MNGYKRYIKAIAKKGSNKNTGEIKTQKKEPSKRRIKILTLDTETRGLHGNVFRIGLYDGVNYYKKNNFKELLPIINHYAKNFDCHIYVHNLEFDLKKGADYLYHGVNLKHTQYINNNAAVFQTKINNLMNNPEEELKNEPITFHCSYQLIPRSLGDISEAFKLNEAGKMDLIEIIKNEHYDIYTIKTRELDEEGSKENYFMNVDPLDENLNKYLKLDCVSLYKIVTTLQELSGLPLYEFIKCPSVASLSLKIYKTLFPDDYKTAISGSKYGAAAAFKEDFLRAAYNGGRTEVFKNRLVDGYYYDVNSLYPYVMKNFKMPVGDPIFFNDHDRIEERLVKDDLNEMDSIFFIEADVYVPDDLNIPVLPSVFRGKLSFLTGYITGIWTDKELKKALEVGCEVEEYKQALYFPKTEFIFKEFVETFEQMKIDSEGAKKFFAKTIMNSLYGKFGMRRKFHTLHNMDELEKIQASGEDYATIYNPHYDKEMIETITYTKAEYIRVHISAYITSIARLVLYDAMEQIEKLGGNIYYCDTDSIFSDIPLPAELIDKDEFGKWKKEDDIEEGVFLASKNYAYISKTGELKKRSKGTPKKYIKGWDYKFYQNLYNEKKKKEKDYIPLMTLTQFQKSKVSLKRSEPMSTFKTIEKGIHLQGQEKRDYDMDANTSKPLWVNFWGEGSNDKPDIEFYKTDPDKYYKLMEVEYYEEHDYLLELVTKVGKIQRPKKTDPYYEDVKNLDSSIREKYFTRNKNNLFLDEFVRGVDNINVIGIIEALNEANYMLVNKATFAANNQMEIC
jgi:DNA polymerase elongation subunit (family B)